MMKPTTPLSRHQPGSYKSKTCYALPINYPESPSSVSPPASAAAAFAAAAFIKTFGSEITRDPEASSNETLTPLSKMMVEKAASPGAVLSSLGVRRPPLDGASLAFEEDSDRVRERNRSTYRAPRALTASASHGSANASTALGLRFESVWSSRRMKDLQASETGG